MPLGPSATSTDEVIGSNSQIQSGDLLICCHQKSAREKKKKRTAEREKKVSDFVSNLVNLLMFNSSIKKTGFPGESCLSVVLLLHLLSVMCPPGLSLLSYYLFKEKKKTTNQTHFSSLPSLGSHQVWHQTDGRTN